MAWIDRWPASCALPLFLVVVLRIIAYSFFVARSFDTFKLADQFRRVEQVAEFIGGYSAERPVIISGEQSGAMRYYTMRPDSSLGGRNAGSTLRAAMTAIERSGHSTYIALDAWEEEPFREEIRGHSRSPARLAADARCRHVAPHAAMADQRPCAFP